MPARPTRDAAPTPPRSSRTAGIKKCHWPLLDSELMFERLGEIGQEIRDVVSWIRRERVAPKEAVSLLQELGRIENTSASARVLLCGRIAETKAWQEKGERSAAHFVARATRTTVATAAESLETAKRLEELPRTAEAFEGGRVSETQVREIASAASLSPSSEQELLHTATTGDVTALREECRRVRSSAITDEVNGTRPSTGAGIFGAGAIRTERFASM